MDDEMRLVVLVRDLPLFLCPFSTSVAAALEQPVYIYRNLILTVPNINSNVGREGRPFDLGHIYSTSAPAVS